MFSCDVLAFETQSAPLWEDVSKCSDESTAKKKETGSETGTTDKGPSEHKRKISHPRRQYGGKRRRMIEYKDCRLCELNFNSELELEEHLFSILHHRALDTEFGKCWHTCNLCGVTVLDLPGYVEHLRNDVHKSNGEKRKAALENGTYKRPEKSLDRFVDSFLCLPARAKQLKSDAEVHKGQVFSNDSNTRDTALEEQKPCPLNYRYYEENPHGWGRGCTRRQRERRDYQRPDYPDWHPMGLYGMHADKCHNDYYNSSGFGMDAFEENPYEKGWLAPSRQNRDRRIYNLEKYVYTRKGDEKWKAGPKSAQDIFLPPTRTRQARKQGGYDDRPLAGGGEKRKELLARARQVIQNGQSASVKAKKKKKGRKSKNASQQSSDNSSVASVLSQDSIISADSKEAKKEMVALPFGARLGAQRQNLKSKKISSAGVQYPMSQSVAITNPRAATDVVCGRTVSNSRPKIATESKSNLSSGSSANLSRSALKASGLRKDKAPTTTPSKLRTTEKGVESVLNKFQKDPGKELGPPGLQKLPPASKSISSSRDSSLSASRNRNCASKNVQRRPGKPPSVDNIRAMFRKILDEIDQPVASASEIVRNAQEISASSATDTSVVTSWAESNCVEGASDATDRSLGRSVLPREFSRSFSTLGSFKSVEDFNSTKYTSLAQPANPASDERIHARQFTTSIGSARSSSPLRDYISLSSDTDTPTNKKRALPQPNLCKARTRITSKQKDSSDAGSDAPPEARQANLSRLLLKYDKAKKNSSDANDEIKKTPGPRFGIELNLQSSDQEAMDMKTLAEKAANLVEIMPEKRVRSLSENDCTLSFATDGTAKLSTDTSATLEPEAAKSGRDSNFPIIQVLETQQRTSTPSGPGLPPAENLNARLLSMSEREESLHTSVRSLSVQEANVQAEIDNRTAALRALQIAVDELNKRKMCVNALKRQHEEELGALRRQRLMLLRNTVPLLSENIFQDVTPNHRQTNNPRESLNLLDMILPQQPHTGSGKADSAAANGAVPGSVETNKTPTRTNMLGAKLPQPQLPVFGVSGSAITAPASTLPDFNLSKVKSEPSCDVDGIAPFSSFLPESQARGNVRVKVEKCDAGYPDFPTQKNFSQPESNGKLGLLDQQNQNERSVNKTMGENSTQFFSVNDGTDSTAEVDKILQKYSRKNTSLQNGVSPKVLTRARKRNNLASPRRSPRNLRSGSKNDTPPTVEPQYKVPEVESNEFAERNNDFNAHEGVKVEKLPNLVKTHDSALVGMQIVKEGLVTCAQDETVLLHGLRGQRRSIKLNATPTTITTAFSGDASLLFVATQKVVMQKQTSDDAEVVKRMEHWLELHMIKTFQGGSYSHDATTIVPISTLRMKARVLCLHYDKRTVFCGMKDGIAAIITLDSKFQFEEDVNLLECHSHSAITCLTSGTEGPRRILCCGSQDCTVSVRDAMEGLLLRTIQGHTKTVTSLQLVHNELFSASVDRLVLGHELSTGKLLHKFCGHAGAVRSLLVISDILVTLCADRNVRFFDTKTCRLLQKPKEVSSLPLYVAVPVFKNGVASPPRDESNIFIGCEDSTIVRMKIPNTRKPTNSSPAKNSENSPWRAPSKSPEWVVNLTGAFECKWEGCAGAGTFVTRRELQEHILGVHIDTVELTSVDDHTLRVGTCCQWESCTHYFAPELDTFRDIRAHIQRHFDVDERTKQSEAGAACP